MKKINYTNCKIADFLKELGSSAPSPGGGSAAALVGALGASLVEMVAGIDLARQKKKGEPGLISRTNLKKASKTKTALVRSMAEDTAAFLRISGFPKEKRDTPSYEKALKNGALAPLKICRLVTEIAGAGITEKPFVSRWLYSDLEEAIILLEAACRSARFNVEVNLRSMKDQAFSMAIHNELDGQKREFETLVREIQSRPF